MIRTVGFDHAANDVRTAFQAAMESWPSKGIAGFDRSIAEYIRSDRARLRLEINSDQGRADWFKKQLSHCSDVLPRLLCDALDLPHGSTYANAAKLI